MTRIRYTTSNRIAKSQQFLCGNILVCILLDLSEMVYSIRNDETVLVMGRASSLVGLKKKAKIAAKELGCQFYDEVRNRGKTERYEV